MSATGRAVLAAVAVGVVASGLSLAEGWKRRHTRCCFDLVPVVVVTHDLPAGAVLTWDDLSQRSIPEQFAGAQDVRPDAVGRAVGMRLRAALGEGERLSWLALEPATSLQPGTRELTLEIYPARALDGTLARGDCVDLLDIRSPRNSPARALARAVPVLRVTHHGEREHVTLLVRDGDELLWAASLDPDQVRLARRDPAEPYDPNLLPDAYHRSLCAHP